MDDNKRQWVTEEVLGEERCATCKYWFGRWRGEIDSRTTKEWTDYVPNDTYELSSGSEQFTYGECRRFPPNQSVVEQVRRYSGLIKWELFNDALRASHQEADRRLSEANEEKQEAEKVAAEHPELWERQMAESKVAKLEKEISKIEAEQEEYEQEEQVERVNSLERFAPEESVRLGMWTSTTHDGWCGEYRRDKEKTDQLIEDLCEDGDRR
jgi:hypothetical protein